MTPDTVSHQEVEAVAQEFLLTGEAKHDARPVLEALIRERRKTLAMQTAVVSSVCEVMAVVNAVMKKT